jgi:hypothetical protein
MLQFTVHSQLINKILRPLLYGAVFLSFLVTSNPIHANIKIAIVDTGFCSQQAVKKSKNHIIRPVRDMTGPLSYDCKKISQKDLKTAERFHGQHVLNEFLSFLPNKMKITIYPMVVYDKNGNQTANAWKKAIELIEKEKMDMVLTASGFITDKKVIKELPAIWFIPSGRTERSITTKTVLFPQSLAPAPNIFVIGDYFDGEQIIYDQALMYQDQIDYYFPAGTRGFSGTSRAVAEAMAKALQKCFIEKDIIAAHSLRLCLLKSTKTLKDPILKKEFKTF